MDARGREPDSESSNNGPSPAELGIDHRSTLADRLDDALVALDELRQRRWFVGGGAVVAISFVVVAWLNATQASRAPVEDLIPQVSLSVTTAVADTRLDTIVVHVMGEVNEPGVYVLEGGQRIEEAVQTAGGATADADLHALNLAAPVVDGSQIRVPAVGDPPVAALVTDPTLSTTEGPVDLNSATAQQLEALPGIGPATSAAIVEYRETNGPFLTLDDLLDVPGIGPAKLAGFGDQAVVR